MRPHRRIRHRVALHFFERRRAWPSRRSARCWSSPGAGSRRRGRSTRSPLHGPCRPTASCRSPHRCAKNWPRFLFDSPKIVDAARRGRAHVHRHLIVAPARRRRPSLAEPPVIAIRDRRVVESGGDHHVVDDERRDGVLFVRCLERHFPQQPAIGRGDADQLVLRLRDDLPHAADRREDRRRVSGTVTGPSPLDGAGGGIHRGQRAGSVPPRNAITFAPSAIGELAVPNSGGAAARSCATAACRSRDRARKRCR